VQVNVTSPDCGDVNGMIEVIATGNHLQYSINVPNFQISPVFYPVAPGTYLVTLMDTFGCTDTETVTILPTPAPVIDNVTVINTDCDVSTGEIHIIASGGVAPLTYALNSGPFGSASVFTMLPAGAYTVKVKGANGGEDSTIVVIQQVGPEVNNTSASICEGGQYVLEGQIFTTAGIHSVTIPGGAHNGCDSTIILSLSVDSLPRKSLIASICQGDFFSIDGHDFMDSGHYVLDTIPAITGCDTIRTLTLSVTPLEIKYLDINICIGDTFRIGPQAFSLPGEFIVDTLSALFGCDSIRKLRLNVDPLNAKEINISICDGEGYVFNG